MKNVKELTEQLKNKQQEIKNIFAEISKRGEDVVPNEDEIKSLRILNEECEAIEAGLSNLQIVNSAKSVSERIDSLLRQPVQTKFAPDVAKSISEKLQENEVFAAWRESLKSGFSELPPVVLHESVKSVISQGVADSAGELPVPTQTGIIDNPFARRFFIRDIIGSGTTDSNSVEYVRVTDFDDNTDGVGEATAILGTSGNKPASDIKFKRVNEPVKTIANTVTTTVNALADGGQLNTLLNQMLGFGLARALDNQIINGTGTNDLTGVLNTPGIQTQAFTNDILETSLRAQTEVSLEFDDNGGGTEATAYVLNPLDWQKFLLFKDSENRFYWGGPSVVGARTLWSLPVFVSSAVPSGTGLVADWSKVIFYDRQQTSVRAFEQHADYARRNMVLLRAETRGALAVVRPAAIVKFPMSGI